MSLRGGEEIITAATADGDWHLQHGADLLL